jgi:AcrR family transcriptional regulator
MNHELEKTRVPQQQRSIRTRQRIVAAAIKVFSEKGYHATNTKEIAKEAGVATGSFYSYFADKLEVFKEALVLYCEQFNAILREGASRQVELNKKKRDVIRAVIEMLLEAHHVYEGFHNELVIMSLSDPEIERLVDEQQRESNRITFEYLMQWKHQLRVTDVEAAATVINMAVHNGVDAIVFKRTDLPAERIIESLVDMTAVYLFDCANPN